MSRGTILDIFESPTGTGYMWETPKNCGASFPLASSVCSPYVFNQDALVSTPDAPSSYANFSTSTPLHTKPAAVVADLCSPFYIDRASTASSADSPVSKVILQALDKEGSRILQRSLNGAPPEAIAVVVEEMLPHIQTVMCDTYANYMCQQLFPCTSVTQRIKILYSLTPCFAAVARDRRGTHSLQALLTLVDCDEERELVCRAVRGKAIQLALDCHATHVLQQVLSCLGPNLVCGLMSEIVSGLGILAIDQFGLGAVKRAIALAESCGFAVLLGSRLDDSLFQLVEDAYGNYSVQHAIENWSKSPGSAGFPMARKMTLRLADRLISLSSHKFASNVAETIIRVSDAALRYKLVKSLVVNPETIAVMMRSPFPVFVVSTALKYCPDAQLGLEVTSLISKHLARLQQPEVKNRAKWEKLARGCSKWDPPCDQEKR